MKKDKYPSDPFFFSFKYEFLKYHSLGLSMKNSFYKIMYADKKNFFVIEKSDLLQGNDNLLIGLYLPALSPLYNKYFRLNPTILISLTGLFQSALYI